MQKHKHNGFTLAELLITVVVIIILISIALVSYKEIAERSVDTKAKQEIVDLEKALRLYHQKYQKMPNGNRSVINLCLINDQSCHQAWQGWHGDSVNSVLSELRKVGYSNAPTAFFRVVGGYDEYSLASGQSDYRYSYMANPYYDDTPIYEGGDYDTPSRWTQKVSDDSKLISAPMVQYRSDGSFYFLYFRDRRGRECPIGKTVTLQHYWQSNGTIEACASHSLDQLP